jgi:hypothetical protein
MLRLLGVTGLSLGLVLLTPAHAAERVALVVGNQSYQAVPKLDNPANDAKRMAGTLTRLGFTLVGGSAQLDLDKADFDQAVQAFGSELQHADIFGKNSHIKDVELHFSNGDSLETTLTDQPGEQRVALSRPVKAKWVQLVIRSVYMGWKYSDTALNELRVDAQ